MFCFKSYWFQVILDHQCQKFPHACKQCDNGDSNPYFNLVVYGWKHEDDDSLFPFPVLNVPNDGILPDVFWEKKLLAL